MPPVDERRTNPPGRPALLRRAGRALCAGRTLPSCRCTPLDGGLYLRAHGWDDRVAALVARHSGLMMAEFDFEDDEASDASTYPDQTVGQEWAADDRTVSDRIAEAISRHGPDLPNARARVDRVPNLLGVADRVERRLAERQSGRAAGG